MPDAPALHAWVDESMHPCGGGLAEGIYLLAATIAAPAECDRIRWDLRELLIGRNERLHWRDETAERRRQIAAAIGSLELVHTVVVGAPLDEHKQERARRLCMELLLIELDRCGVRQVWVESRKATQNSRDLRMLDAVRNKGVIGAGLHLDFALPKAEPMLWLPDAVAGAVGLAHRHEDLQPRDLLGDKVIELRRLLT